MMSVERYACVARPLDPASRMTRSKALCVVFFIWTYSSVFSVMPVFGFSPYVPEGYLTSCSFDYLSDEFQDKCFILSYFVAAWCLPMVIVCYCYIGIVRCVGETQRLFQRHAQSLQERTLADRNVEHKRRLEIKLAKISFFLISSWTIAWTPYAVVALLGVFTDRSMLTPLTSMVPAVFCKLASVADPFIYGLSNRQFKSELIRKLVTVCKIKKFRERNVSSYLMRTMSGKSREISITEENADYSLSLQDHPESTVKGDTGINVQGNVQPENGCNKEDKESNKSEAAEQNLPKEQSGSNSHKTSHDSELNNNAELKRIQVFPIPQIYVIERHDDIIKLKSRRSV